MSRPAYLPTGVPALDVWLRNFVLKLPAYAADLKISDNEIKELEDQLRMHSLLLQHIAYMESVLDNLYRFKEVFVDGKIQDELHVLPNSAFPPTLPLVVVPGLVKRIARLVKRIKTMPIYTNIIGIDLRIIPPKTNRNAAYSVKPDIKLSLDGNRPLIKWKKNGVEAIDVLVDRADGAGFVLCGSTTRSKFADTHPLPKVLTPWTYRIIHKKGSTPTGYFSEARTIAVME